MADTPWTIEALRQHLDQRFGDLEKRLDAAIDSSRRAIDIAERYNEAWRASTNEWRGAMSDRERSFVNREEFDVQIRNLEKGDQGIIERMDAFSKRIDLREGQRKGLEDGWVRLIGLVALAATLISIYGVLRG